MRDLVSEFASRASIDVDVDFRDEKVDPSQQCAAVSMYSVLRMVLPQMRQKDRRR